MAAKKTNKQTAPSDGEKKDIALTTSDIQIATQQMPCSECWKMIMVGEPFTYAPFGKRGAIAVVHPKCKKTEDKG